MKKKSTKKSTAQITLALISSVAIGGCGGEPGYRDVYRSKSDCMSEWSASDCESIGSDSSDYYSGGRYYGPFRSNLKRSAVSSAHPSSSLASKQAASSRSMGIASVTRGGFGHSSGSHSSGS